MTEIGMVLSNPLDGERRPGIRRPAAAGRRRPAGRRAGRRGGGRGHRAKSKSAAPACSWSTGASPTLTRAAFHDGWFRTGDVGVLDEGSYRLLGPSQRRHHQDRRLQDLGARDRGRAARASRGRRLRRRRRRPIRRGASASARPSSSAPAPRSHSRICRPGCGPASRRTRSRRTSRACPPFRATRWGKWSSRKSRPGSSKTLAASPGGPDSFAGGPRKLCREVRAASPRGPGLLGSPRTSPFTSDFSAHPGLLNSPRTSQSTPDFSVRPDFSFLLIS